MAEREVRSIAYHIKSVRFPAYKDLANFDFAASEVNEATVRQLHRGEFTDRSDNVVLICGPSTGKTHLATALGVQGIEHSRKKVRFFSTVDLVNALEQEKTANRAGQLADRLLHLDVVVLDELGYSPDSRPSIVPCAWPCWPWQKGRGRMSAWDIAKRVTGVAFPLGGLIAEGVEVAYKAINKASDQGIEQLTAEVAKQELRLKFELQQAKIAQELAIAQRILNAEVVEIEEFYDVSGSGQAGLNATAESMSLGLNIEGKRVTKRIYQFKGGQRPVEMEEAGRVGSEPTTLRSEGPTLL